jgi:hypothetical protein
VNPKGKTQFSFVPNSMVLLISNDVPQIDVTEEHQRTRALVIPVKTFTGDMTQVKSEVVREFVQEFWSFLWKCREEEWKLCAGKNPPPILDDKQKLFYISRCKLPLGEYDPPAIFIKQFCKPIVEDLSYEWCVLMLKKSKGNCFLKSDAVQFAQSYVKDTGLVLSQDDMKKGVAKGIDCWLKDNAVRVSRTQEAKIAVHGYDIDTGESDEKKNHPILDKKANVFNKAYETKDLLEDLDL